MVVHHDRPFDRHVERVDGLKGLLEVGLNSLEAVHWTAELGPEHARRRILECHVRRRHRGHIGVALFGVRRQVDPGDGIRQGGGCRNVGRHHAPVVTIIGPRRDFSVRHPDHGHEGQIERSGLIVLAGESDLQGALEHPVLSDEYVRIDPEVGRQDAPRFLQLDQVRASVHARRRARVGTKNVARRIDEGNVRRVQIQQVIVLLSERRLEVLHGNLACYRRRFPRLGSKMRRPDDARGERRYQTGEHAPAGTGKTLPVHPFLPFGLQRSRPFVAERPA